MIQTALLGWEKNPPALIDLKEGLAAEGPAGWQPSRLILQNYWRFSYEEFHFAQGRLVLRGANATGKSTVLVSAITFALDMEKRRERLDTFGSQGRGMAYYLVGEPDSRPDSDFYFPERTGYVALEFVHRERGCYLTIGVGLYATRSRSDLAVDSWGFVITDGRRLGYGLNLYDEASIPLSTRALREVLGTGGHVADRAADYQALVNRHLFGFSSASEYEFLLTLLLQLRSPKLNKDTRPSDIRAMLADSLPPLPGGLLTQVIQIIDDIDTCLEILEETKTRLEAATAIDERQALYLNQLAQRAAVHYLEAAQQVAEAQAEEERARRQLAKAQDTLESVELRLAANETERRANAGRLASLEAHEAFRHEAALSTLEHDLVRATKAVAGARQALGSTAATLQQAQERKATVLQRWSDARISLLDGARQLTPTAEQAAWPLAVTQAQAMQAAISAFTATGLPENEPMAGAMPAEAVEAAAGEREAALVHVRNALASAEQAEQQHRIAQVEVKREQQGLDDAGDQIAKADQAYDGAREAAGEALAAWSKGCQAYRPQSPALDATWRAVAALQASDDAAAIRRASQPILESLRLQQRQASASLDQLRLRRDSAEEQRNQLARQLAEWETEKDPEPLRRPGQVQARALLAERGIAAHPLYSVCELRADLPLDTAAATEQALDEAGLLDALVVPQEKMHEVAEILAGAGMGDRWLRTAKTAAPSSLLRILQPISGHPATTDIVAALAGIAWYSSPDELQEAPLAGRLPNQPATAIAPGAWRVGQLAGRSERRPQPSVLYIGEANRRKHREAIIAELRSEIGAHDAALRECAGKIDVARRNLEQLRREEEALRDLAAWDGIRATAVAVMEAQRHLETRQKALEAAEKLADQAYRKLALARSAYQEALSTAPEARGRNQEGLSELIGATQAFVLRLQQLQREAHSAARLRDDFQHVAALIDGLQTRARGDEQTLLAAQHHVEELTARKKAVLEYLQELGADLEALHREISRLRSRQEVLQQEAATLHEERGRQAHSVQSLQEALEAAGARLADAAAQEERYRQLLAERLRTYPTLQEYLTNLTEPGADPVAVAQSLLRLRRAGEHRLLEAVEKGIHDAFQNLAGTLTESRAALAEYSPELLDGLVTFREMGTPLAPYQLKERLAADLALQSQVLQEKESELYEDIILREVAREIRERIALAHAWCDAVNALLGAQQLSNGETLAIQWRTKPVDRATGSDLGRVVALLRRDVETLTDMEVTQLVEHFRQRVGEVREHYRQNALGEKSFATALEEVLDYRAWFEFHLFSKLPGEERRALTDQRFATRSGAEKSLAMFIPILAAVHARYQSAAPDAPRLVGLDEAFAGVDEQNIRAMFGFLVELGFSWIMTSEKLWGVGDSLPACSTYELVKGDTGVIAPVWFVWEGRRLLSASTNGEGR